MIQDYVSISIKNNELGNTKYLSKTKNSISLTYPCLDQHKCTPYVIDIEKGVYKIECWGSAAGKLSYENAKPGLGGYTSGTIFITEKTQLYVYIGNKGFFNAVKELETSVLGVMPGGATDVRLNTSEKWWESGSLASRIMVAAGGGSAEWNGSIGGNGGGLQGGESISSNNSRKQTVYEPRCKGGTQIKGSDCQQLGKFVPVTGEFGSGGKTNGVQYSGNIDYGGFGGGGYYGGTSYTQCLASSGGSSFISGHKGCDAIKSQTDLTHSGDSIHYSGLVFSNTKMIPGNTSMPLPYSHSNDIYNGIGAFRISLIMYQNECSIHKRYYISNIAMYILLFL